MWQANIVGAHAPNEMTEGVRGDLLLDLDKGITVLLDSLKYNLAA